MAEPNYGISNSGTGHMDITNSPISFDGGSRTASPPVTSSGPGGVTIDGKPVGPITARGSEDVYIGGGAGGSGAPAREYRTWDDVPKERGGSGGSRWGGSAGGSAGPGVAEFGDLASVRRFAEQVCALGEGSDFVQVIKACGGLKDMMRDLGGDVNREVAAFMDAAIAVARDGEELKEQAAMVARLAVDLSGGS